MASGRSIAIGLRVATFATALVVFWGAFRWVLVAFRSPPPDALLSFAPPDEMVAPLLAMLFAIIASDIVGQALLRRFSPANAADGTNDALFGQSWANRRARPIYAAGAVIALLGAWLTSQWSVYVTPSSILIHPFWGFQTQRHGLADVTFIGSSPMFIAPAGNQVPRREMVVRFRDGTGWSTVDSPRRCTPQQVDQLTRYLSERSAVPVTPLTQLSRSDW